MLTRDVEVLVEVGTYFFILQGLHRTFHTFHNTKWKSTVSVCTGMHTCFLPYCLHSILLLNYLAFCHAVEEFQSSLFLWILVAHRPVIYSGYQNTSLHVHVHAFWFNVNDWIMTVLHVCLLTILSPEYHCMFVSDLRYLVFWGTCICVYCTFTQF